MSFFTPNFAITSSWMSTLKAAFSQLRRKAFAVDETFTFLDFDPKIDFQGMVVTNYKLYQARQLTLNKLMFVHIRFYAFLAAPLAMNISITLPNTMAGTNFGYTLTGVMDSPAAIAEPLPVVGGGGSTTLNLIRYSTVGGTPFPAGGAFIRISGFVEVT